MEELHEQKVTNSDVAEIGKRLRKRRVKLKITQEELAEKMGLSKNTIFRYENGEMQMKISALYQFAELLDMTPNELFPIRLRCKDVKGEKSENIIKLLSDLDEAQLDIVYNTMTALIDSLKKLNKTRA